MDKFDLEAGENASVELSFTMPQFEGGYNLFIDVKGIDDYGAKHHRVGPCVLLLINK